MSTETPSQALDIDTPETTSADEVEWGAPEAEVEAEVESAPDAAPDAMAESNGEVTPSPSPRPGALPAWWTDAYPQVSNVHTATAYLDAIGGAMSRQAQDGRWVLSTGEQVLFEADTSEELDGFILGFALSQLISERHGPISQARRG
jgi:hypothetical protein